MLKTNNWEQNIKFPKLIPKDASYTFFKAGVFTAAPELEVLARIEVGAKPDSAARV